jgi:hypothetical protein
MRATTTNNGTDGVVEKERRIFVFYIPVSISNLLILDSRSFLFHNYRIWPWAFRPMGYPWAGHALCKSLHKPKPVDHYFFMGLTSAAIEAAKTWQIVGPNRFSIMPSFQTYLALAQKPKEAITATF